VEGEREERASAQDEGNLEENLRKLGINVVDE